MGVDVSTAYCNCNQTNIEEKIYEAPGNPRGMVEMCQWMDPDIINSPEATRKMIGDRPNTYTFTKALAESLLANESVGLPVAVMRPSIVAASLEGAKAWLGGQLQWSQRRVCRY